MSRFDVTSLRVLCARVGGLLRPWRHRDRLSLEIEGHLDALRDEFVARGMSPADARLAALRAFGGVDRIAAVHREQRGLPSVDALISDVGFTLRVLAREHTLTAAIVVMLGLALGINTALFTIVSGMTWRGLPVERGDRIMEIHSESRDGRRERIPASIVEFRNWQAATRTFASLAAYAGAGITLSDEGHPGERVGATYVSSNAFGVLRVAPVLGRDFTSDEDRPGSAPVVMIGHHLWTQRYASDPLVVGRTVRINGIPAVVSGVMPEKFRFPVQADIWLPLGSLPGLTASSDRRTLAIFGRLQDDATLESARAEFSALATRTEGSAGGSGAAAVARVVPFTYAFVAPLSESIEPVLAMIGGVLVLLVACANAGHLLLARVARRTREVALRASLGAARSRIVRQLLFEAFLLAAAASLFGLLLSVSGVRWFTRETIDVNLPYWIAFEFDARVFLYVTLVCALTAVAFGLAPAWQLSRTDPAEILKDGARGQLGGRGSSRWINLLMITEVALTLVLVSTAGLLASRGLTLYSADRALDLDRVLSAQIAVPEQYAAPDRRAVLQKKLHDRLNRAASISSAALMSARPFVESASRRLRVDGQPSPAQLPIVQSVAIGDAYFDTLNIALLRGRPLSGSAAPGAGEVVINERLARLYFRDGDALGQRIQLLPENADAAGAGWLTIVGIAPSIRQRMISPALPLAYTSLAAEPQAGLSVALRGSHDAPALAATLRRTLHEVDRDLAAHNIMPLRRLSELSRFVPRFLSGVLVLLGLIASVLSATGVFGVTAFGVSQRTSEIGLRMALGARRGQIAWLFLRRTSLTMAAGLAIGLVASLAVGRVLQAALVGSSPLDAVIIAAAALLLIVIAAIASFLPARQAMTQDPVVALRHD